ncbi:sensor histidine kinase [Hamadaea tsunoensis]|uniref:sensor histidine kinase n=1 Tax=Hamadaea tsunoensis TaxID=53368 RepID=UPI0012FBB2F3|nr:histidine kinase [Hamadaea tsunoensis]
MTISGDTSTETSTETSTDTGGSITTGAGCDPGTGRDRVGIAIALAGVGTLSALTLIGHHSVLDWVVAVACLALTPVALYSPIGGGLAANVLAALSPAATPLASASALYAGRLRRFPQAALVAVAGVAAHAVQGWWRPVAGASYGFWLALIAAAYAALVGWGAWLRARDSLLRSLRERARRAEQEQSRRVGEARLAERTRIAREMHDVLAHRLSLVATYAGALEYRPDSSPQQLSAAAGVVREGVRQALEELRAVIGVLRADEAEVLTPQPVLADIPALVEESRAVGVAVVLREEVDGTPPELAGRTAYRVVQEALTNARKHAPGRPVTVTVTGAAGGELAVEVTNPLPDNASLLPASGSDQPGGGTGLIGLAERVRLAGGTLEHSRSAGTFRLHARLPWPV